MRPTIRTSEILEGDRLTRSHKFAMGLVTPLQVSYKVGARGADDKLMCIARLWMSVGLVEAYVALQA